MAATGSHPNCPGCDWDAYTAANPRSGHIHLAAEDGPREGCCAHTHQVDTAPCGCPDLHQHEAGCDGNHWPHDACEPMTQDQAEAAGLDGRDGQGTYWGGEVTAAQVRDAIHRADPECPVLVAQTGGGTATLYLGTPAPAPSAVEDGRYWLSLGPGSYNWGEPWASTFFLGNGATSIGPDDDGQAPYADADCLGAITAYVAGAPR